MASGKLIKRRLLFKRICRKNVMPTNGIDTVWRVSIIFFNRAIKQCNGKHLTIKITLNNIMQLFMRLFKIGYRSFAHFLSLFILNVSYIRITRYNCPL